MSVVVKVDSMAAYERWLKKVETALTEQKGFVGIEVIRPADRTAPEYFILLRFATLPDLEAWKSSAVLEDLRQESRDFVVHVEIGERQYGTEMFFSRPLSNIYYPRPPFRKQALIGIATVYPLILLSGALLRPLLQNLPASLNTFLTICVMAPIMITVMPKVSMLFKNWLYPTA